MNTVKGSVEPEKPRMHVGWAGILRDPIAAVLLVIAAILAVVAFVDLVISARAAGPAAQIAEVWIMLGFLVYAVIFLLLARKPREYPGIFELSIFQHGGVAVAVFLITGGLMDTKSLILLIEGLLAVLLIAAYLLSAGWMAWARCGSCKAPLHFPLL